MLPATVRGAAFKTSSGITLVVLWARTEGDESASAAVALPASGSATVHTFGVSKGSSSKTVEPEAGKLSLALTGMPTAVELP